MTERPIIFSGPMVKALLAGRKSMTRRLLKPQPFADDYYSGNVSLDRVWLDGTARFSASAVGGGAIREEIVPLRYAVGDSLWVRETWGVVTRPCPNEGWRDGIEYRADDTGSGDDLPLHAVDADLSGIKSGWRPSIHMPRWASRITLRVTDVRVQRLQEISQDDAEAEGVEPWGICTWKDYAENGITHVVLSPKESFKSLWEKLHSPDSWSANPWIVALTFERVK